VLLDALSGEARIAWSGDEGVYSNGYGPTFDVARDGVTSVVVRSSFSEAPEVWAGPIGQWRQVTHLNSDQHAEWGEAKSVEWDSDGMRVQGWLIAPKDVSGTVRYPLVVEAHGGPASVAHPGWPREFFSAVPLAAAGYYVFLPNPRGSYGQGEDFTRANVKDFGGGDLRDILAGIDKVLEIAPVDQKRIGLTGWSYGGFMTMFAVTQTDRFRAAVAGAGIANWQSYYGENSIDQWMIPYFGATVYADAAPYARASAINFITRVKTPTLVVVGERDGECPAPQSFEFWHALKTLGVKTQLVVYPGEGHGFRKPDHRRDVFRRMAAWFQENLR
jgi:dipeptidyl aminopeptidase/acylaminoacyl peptidase